VAAYVASVLRSLGYETRVKTFTDIGAYYGALEDPRQRFDLAWSAWLPTFPSAADVLYPLFSCPSFRPRAKDWSNFGRFCSPPIDREIGRALRLEIGDPQAAGTLWGRVDHDLADQAAAMPFAIGQNFDLVSIRVGNYQRNPFWGPLFDQMWVK
jgi:ABC-type oligopeptide transport system substrate-binding subunit